MDCAFQETDWKGEAGEGLSLVPGEVGEVGEDRVELDLDVEVEIEMEVGEERGERDFEVEVDVLHPTDDNPESEQVWLVLGEEGDTYEGNRVDGHTHSWSC